MKVTRKAQKAETRQKLMDATVAELARGRSYDTLSLREISKLAGIAPTSFYRHFHDMEGLGLALMEEHGNTLLDLMHRVREQASGGHSLIRTSVETLFDYIFANQGMARMILQESMSQHSVFSEAAENLFTTMSDDLAEFLIWDAKKRDVPLAHPHLAANSMVAILFTTGIALLNRPAEDHARHIEAAIVQLRLIMRGAEAMGQATG
ncbi:MAG: HTH-type transcriptional repressor FabR [Gammaproteobacteria bacterium]|nr:HTH-type transcriptional repressor FabR [Gammaproteobacteria bacterium]MDH5618417.1 HTH-type transcriptional repressor FabR [Gammaproteobacteria bacterium]